MCFDGPLAPWTKQDKTNKCFDGTKLKICFANHIFSFQKKGGTICFCKVRNMGGGGGPRELCPKDTKFTSLACLILPKKYLFIFCQVGFDLN